MRYLTLMMTMLMFTGCGFLTRGPWGGGGDDWVDEYDSPPEYGTVDGRIEGAWVGGQMVDIGTFEGDAYEANYIGGYGYTSLTLHAGDRGGDDFGWAMIRLETSDEGGFESDNFAPGTSHTADVSAVGCTGPTHGNYNFDGGADTVTITVEPGPTDDSRLFHYFAEFSTEGHTEGSFVLYMN